MIDDDFFVVNDFNFHTLLICYCGIENIKFIKCDLNLNQYNLFENDLNLHNRIK